MKRLAAVLLLVLLVVPAEAGRRRAVRSPAPRPATPEAWLATYAYALDTIEGLPASSADLQPLQALIGSAQIIALGDPTHGTRESALVKLRLLDFFVREMNADTIVLEAPFTTMQRVDDWVQGGPGDALALMKELSDLYYVFWDFEDFVPILQRLREYNAHRGDRPAVHLAGADIYDDVKASEVVLAYLRAVDPAAAADAEAKYACVRAEQRDSTCSAQIAPIRQGLLANAAELIARSSQSAFDDTAQHARVIEQGRTPYTRDDAMHENILWHRAHRSAGGRTVVWAHNAHVMKASGEFNAFPFGEKLAATLGDEHYFAIGLLTGSGSFLRWNWVNNGPLFAETIAFEPLAADSYEAFFRLRPAPALLVPLNGVLPAWLPERGRYNIAGSSPSATWNTGQLARQFDAILYIDATTPMRPVAR